MLLFFSLFLTSTVEGWRIIIFLRTHRPPYCQWQFGKKCKPGLQLAFAQTWSSLSQASFPMPLHQSWAGTEHFQLIMSFLICLLLFILPLFFHLQRRQTVNL